MSSEAGRPPRDAPLTDPVVMRALAHPVRTSLIELLSVLDTVTATQASELLGESPANCAFHLRTLAKYGFVAEAGGGKGRERPWRLAQREISVTAVQDDPQAALAADALSRMWLDQWIEQRLLPEHNHGRRRRPNREYQVAEYAIAKPAREMLFTVVDQESKYKAKNVIDTVVYRGGDLLAASASSAVLAYGLSGLAVLGVAVSAVWFPIALVLGRRYEAARDTGVSGSTSTAAVG